MDDDIKNFDNVRHGRDPSIENGVRVGAMTEFCGWIGARMALPEAEATLAGMADATGANVDGAESLLSPSGAITSTSPLQSGPDNLRAVIAGTPNFSASPTDRAVRDDPTGVTLIERYVNAGRRIPVQPRGAYSYVIADFDNDRAILATDRFGIQPLYYTILPDNSLAFASNIAGLLRHPKVTGDLDSQSLFNFVYFHMIPSPATVFEGISKLEPGHCIVYERGGVEHVQHWHPEFVDDGRAHSSYDVTLKQTIRGAVERSAARSENKVGAFLSGGLDSSTVCGMLSEVQDGPTHAYSIGFDQEGFDEMEYARIAAKHFDLELHEYYVTPSDVATAIPIIAAAYQEPFGNSSAVPTFFCAKLAKDDGVDLLLAGDGGDELFAGNERYARQKLFAVYDRLPGFLKQKILEPIFASDRGIGSIWPFGKVSSYIEQAKVPMPKRMQTYNFVQRTPLEQIFNPAFLETIDANSPYSELERVWEQTNARSIVNRMLYLDWKFTLADNDLQKVNRMCEHANMRVAYPMLDDDVSDLSLLVPPADKLKRLRLRHFFKRSMSDFLPDAIINKRKHGFGLPFGYWLQESQDLQRIVYGSLEALKDREIFHGDFIGSLLETYRSGHMGYYGEMIWVLAILEQWFQHHAD